jgi:plastocyanin
MLAVTITGGREERGMMSLQRIAFVFVVVTASLAGTLAAAAGGGASAGAQTFKVDVDGRGKAINEAFLAYFPSVLRVHAGDTVVFRMAGNGEPHTVTLGTLADRAVSGYEALTPQERQAPHPPLSLEAADGALPQLLPQGPGDAIQSAANRCFVESGAPGAALCPNSQHVQPEFDGSQSFYNSGWLNSDQRFSVHLSNSTAPGTYRFMCLLHRESMSGRIVVVPSSANVQSPAAQYAAGQRQLAAVQAKLLPAATALRSGKPPLPVALPGANPVLAGSGSQNVDEAEITQFGPSKVHIPVGGSVTWYLIGPHSITFNSNANDDDIRLVAPDGTVHLNPKAVAPVNSPGEPAPTSNGGGPSNGPPRFRVVASSSWNGRGFHNSGVFVNSFGPPLIEGYKLTFTKAGTYRYICTVHDRMKGEVDVG